MGRQINFYMSENVQISFIEFLEQKQFELLNYYSKIEAQPTSNSVYDMYLYKQNYGDIIMRQDIKNHMNVLTSPVIQFRKTSIREDSKEISQGRLWMEHSYYDDDGTIIKKNKEFIKDYNELVRWVKKNVPYQIIKREEVEFKYYINDEMIEMQKQGFSLK